MLIYLDISGGTQALCMLGKFSTSKPCPQHGSSVVDVLRTLQSVHQDDYRSLHSHPQYPVVINHGFSPRSYPDYLLDDSHPNSYKPIVHCGFF